MASLLVFGPLPAAALPFLRPYLQGEVDTLGRGGAEAFRDLGAEALRLERPTLLAGSREILVSIFLENETTLSLRAGAWDGTRANDQRLGLTAVVPVGEAFEGMPIALLVGLRRDSGETRIQSKKNGLLLHLEEEREWAVVGFTSSLPYGVSLAASVEPRSGGSPQWMADLRFHPMEATTFWLRRRGIDDGYRVRIPDGVATKVYSPELSYLVELQRDDLELGGELRSDDVWLLGGVLADSSPDYWAEAGGRPLPWFALRVGADRSVDRFVDPIRADGTGTIASVELGLRRQRIFAGADLELGPRDGLTVRYIHSILDSVSSADEVGTNAARAFLHVDYDFGLDFRSGYRIRGDQLAVGWSHRTLGGVDYSMGAQYFRLDLPPGSYALTSQVLDRALAAESMIPTSVDLLGLTGSIDFPIGAFQLGAAVGQYLPVATHQPGEAGSGSSGGKSSKGGGPFDWVGKLAKGLQDYGGGNRLLFRITSHF